MDKNKDERELKKIKILSRNSDTSEKVPSIIIKSPVEGYHESGRALSEYQKKRQKDLVEGVSKGIVPYDDNYHGYIIEYNISTKQFNARDPSTPKDAWEDIEKEQYKEFQYIRSSRSGEPPAPLVCSSNNYDTLIKKLNKIIDERGKTWKKAFTQFDILVLPEILLSSYRYLSHRHKGDTYIPLKGSVTSCKEYGQSSIRLWVSFEDSKGNIKRTNATPQKFILDTPVNNKIISDLQVLNSEYIKLFDEIRQLEEKKRKVERESRELVESFIHPSKNDVLRLGGLIG